MTGRINKRSQQTHETMLALYLIVHPIRQQKNLLRNPWLIFLNGNTATTGLNLAGFTFSTPIWMSQFYFSAEKQGYNCLWVFQLQWDHSFQHHNNTLSMPLLNLPACIRTIASSWGLKSILRDNTLMPIEYSLISSSFPARVFSVTNSRNADNTRELLKAGVETILFNCALISLM